MSAAQERILVDDKWYVAVRSARTEEAPQVLKRGESFALFDRFGDVRDDGSGEQGIYREDTRFISRHFLTLGGTEPMFLGANVKEGNNVLIAELMNPDLEQINGERLHKGEVHVFRAKLLLDGVCYEHIRLTHFGLAPVHFELSMRFEADFADVFEVRGMTRQRQGQMLPVQHARDALVLGYRGLDDRTRRSHIRLQPAPERWDGHAARYDIHLAPHQQVHLYCTISCEIEGQPAPTPLDYETAYWRNDDQRQKQQQRHCRMETSNPLMNRWLARSAADLAMLSTDLPTGPYPYAGVPWYSTTFGRDGLITAREMLWLDPSLARGVLAFLASTQATSVDRAHDAEPGKILHEARQCEMARTGEVPFERYYGTVDATPLFIALAGAYHRRTGDLDFIRSIWPNLLAALDWMDRYGDIDGDGFIEYARRSSNGLEQQGWKDSHDSIFHVDGRMAVAPIALCEVQGYAYEAKCAAGELADALGEPELGPRMRAEAAALRRNFQQQFWCEDLGCYAIALDGQKRPCRVVSSNAGHALWTGIASPEHAARMAHRLMEPDVFTGWGVRTLASGQARYNPMSYHNGSIWPHDTALLASGLARYGHTEQSMRLLTALYESSLHFSQHRLPELFCGFPRRPGEGPTLYPVACSPQAWASAAVFAMLQACLGLELDAQSSCAWLHSPKLPDLVEWLRVCDLRIGDSCVDLLIKRYENNVGVEVTRKVGAMEVRVSV